MSGSTDCEKAVVFSLDTQEHTMPIENTLLLYRRQKDSIFEYLINLKIEISTAKKKLIIIVESQQ